MFPLIYLSLELPKRIINDVIGAQDDVVRYFGYAFSQETSLAVLCATFLIVVLGLGLLKMRVNTLKGVLSERMLRRLRYLLIERMLRFPKPYVERLSQSELSSIITAESEPMGGLMGDAISQPVLQAGQMITILGFLFLQSVWFGLAACALIPLQAWLIPRLQRQINLLNKARIVEVRALSATIGESAAGASALRLHGGRRRRLAEVTDQLGRLFDIRYRIYSKKFFMKFINNFITQLTPFFFFSVGGYLVLRGHVSLGALVAALAAYKDLSSPWKELLTYYNQVQDMSVRWEVLRDRFAPEGLLDEALFADEPAEPARLNGDIRLNDVSVQDANGNLIVQDMTAIFPAGASIAIQADNEEDCRAFCHVLSREVLPSSGTVELSGQALTTLHQSVIAARVGRVTARPTLFRGSFGDNVTMPLSTRPTGGQDAQVRDPEALRTGNSPDPLDADWLDPTRAGVADHAALRDWWLQLIDGIGFCNTLFLRGLDQKLDPAAHPELTNRLIALRPLVQERLEAAGLRDAVYVFQPELYNPAVAVAENLLFSTSAVPVTGDLLRSQSGFLKQLQGLGLDRDLVALACDIIDILRQIFGHDGTGHPLFRKLGLEPAAYLSAEALVGQARKGGFDLLQPQDLITLIVVPFRIAAEKVGTAFPDEVKARILSLRKSHSEEAVAALGGMFIPLDPESFAPGLTVLENALFGKVAGDAGSGKEEAVRALIADLLIEQGLQNLVIELIFDLTIELGGKALPAQFAEPLSFCRATIKRPDILLMDHALGSYAPHTRAGVFRNLRHLLPDCTMIFLDDEFDDAEEFDAMYRLEQGRLRREDGGAAPEVDDATASDLAQKLRALERTALFSSLDRKQLRLLAFGARWFEAPAGAVIFRKDDPPGDGAYLLLEGEAQLSEPRDGGFAHDIARVSPGTLVGELALIRNVPRTLTMTARTDLRCLRIGAGEFLAVVENDAATAFKLLQVVSGYVRG